MFVGNDASRRGLGECVPRLVGSLRWVGGDICSGSWGVYMMSPVESVSDWDLAMSGEVSFRGVVIHASQVGGSAIAEVCLVIVRPVLIGDGYQEMMLSSKRSVACSLPIYGFSLASTAKRVSAWDSSICLNAGSVLCIDHVDCQITESKVMSGSPTAGLSRRVCGTRPLPRLIPSFPLSCFLPPVKGLTNYASYECCL